MIQTQLLRLDPPYQIISAGGHVGIQVATLIVVEESDADSNASVFPRNFHSYPVVNYGLKQGLDEMMKYHNNPLDREADWTIRRRLQPEGAVWQGVEVKDVKVLGLAGANNDAVNLDYFIYLVPTVWRTDPSLHVWDRESTSRIYELYQGLGNVGLKTSKLPFDFIHGKKVIPIKFVLESTPAFDGFYVKVVIKEDIFSEDYDLPDMNIYFRCIIDPSKPESISDCATTIAEGLNGIKYFLPTRDLEFSWDQIFKPGDKDFSDAMIHLMKLVRDSYEHFSF